MWEFIVKNWGPLYALASLVGLVIIILLSKTYAKREDLTALVQRVQRVEQVLADLRPDLAVQGFVFGNQRRVVLEVEGQAMTLRRHVSARSRWV